MGLKSPTVLQPAAPKRWRSASANEHITMRSGGVHSEGIRCGTAAGRLARNGLGKRNPPVRAGL